MHLSILTIEQVADLIEKAEYSGKALTIQHTVHEVIYRMQEPTGESILINTPYANYLVQTDVSDGLQPLTSNQQPPRLKYC